MLADDQRALGDYQGALADYQGALADYQRALKEACLANTLPDRLPGSLAGERWRWELYRTMVRSRLQETIEHSFERTLACVGRDLFAGWVATFYERRGPKSPYLRDVPGEFLEFMLRAEVLEAEGGKPYLPDLMRYEWAELDTAYTAEEVAGGEVLSGQAGGAGRVVELVMDKPAVLTAAHRLLLLEHPVHRCAFDGEARRIERQPVSLCLYRDPVTFEVRTLELTEITRLLLEELVATGRPLSEVVKSVAGRMGALIDVTFVEALSGLLADFLERGLLLGSWELLPSA